MAIYNNRICKECGIIFSGGPRAWYCPKCRQIRERERTEKYRREGFSRQIGSIDYCKNCGKQYIVNGGNQKYCADCKEEMLRKIDNEQGTKYYHERVDKEEKNRKRRLRYSKTPEFYRIKKRKYYIENAEKIQKSIKEYRMKNPEKIKQWYENRKKKVDLNEYMREYREKNKDKFKAYAKKRYWEKKAGERIIAICYTENGLEIVFGNCAKHGENPYFRATDGTEYRKYKPFDEASEEEKKEAIEAYNKGNEENLSISEILKKITEERK